MPDNSMNDPSLNGVLGNGALPQMAPWQSALGILGSGLKDAAAYMGRRPEDATNVTQYGQEMRQYNAQAARQRAVSAMAADDPNVRQQGYQAAMALGMDPSPYMKLQANKSMPALLQAMTSGSQINNAPVGITPAVTATGPQADAQRQAANQTNSSPITQGLPLDQAMSKVGSPELQTDLAPEIIQARLAAQSKMAEPYTLEPGASRYIGNTKIAGGSNPNQPFNSDGSPNEGFQKFELEKATAAARARLAAMYGIVPGMGGGGAGGSGADDPRIANYGANVLNGQATLANVPMPFRGQVSDWLATKANGDFSPTSQAKFTRSSSLITHPYTSMSGYKLMSDAAPYIARINAASKTPGSVSDQDLLDSLTKLNTGGNAVTDAQVSLITNGKSYKDWLGTVMNKFQNGGVLSPDQRKQVVDISHNIYGNYRKTYQPIYDKASQQLTAAGIPKQFWTMPDIGSIGDQQMQSIGETPVGGGGASSGWKIERQ